MTAPGVAWRARRSVLALLQCLLVMASGMACSAHAASLPPRFVDALRRAEVPLGAASVYVQEVGRPSNRPLLALNADKPMNPASTMKLVTTYAALELLGPAYTWKTTVASTARRLPDAAGDILDGDLVIKGSGDPKLVLENFWLMLRHLRAAGIRDIRGDLVLDHSLFEAPANGTDDAAKFDGEPYRAYNVVPDALLVNFKTVTLRFVPDATRRVVRVSAEPQPWGLMPGPVAWLDGPCDDWRAQLGADYADPRQPRFGGGFPGSCGPRELSVSLYSHTEYVGGLFRQLWAELGGTLRGTVRDGVLPVGATVLAEQESPQLAEIVRDINKYSNNVMARELFLALPAELLKLPANPERARRVLRDFLTGKGLEMPELVLENGAGLSRLERISALNLGRLLLTAAQSPVQPEFVSSLALVGQDGTMRRRTRDLGVAGQAHIKTGTLADTRAIAGYVLAASGRRFVVVSLLNHANAQRAQAAHDSLLEWVYEH